MKGKHPAGLPSPTSQATAYFAGSTGPRSSSRREYRAGTVGSTGGGSAPVRACSVAPEMSPRHRDRTVELSEAFASMVRLLGACVESASESGANEAPRAISAGVGPAGTVTDTTCVGSLRSRGGGVGGLALVSAPCSTAPGDGALGQSRWCYVGQEPDEPSRRFSSGLAMVHHLPGRWWELPPCREAAQPQVFLHPDGFSLPV